MDTYQFKYLLLECLRDDKFCKAVEDLLNGKEPSPKGAGARREPSLDWVDDYLPNKNIKI